MQTHKLHMIFQNLRKIIFTHNCRNCNGEIVLKENINHKYNCTYNKLDNMIHEVDYKGLTVIENKNNIYRYKCNNNCNIAHLPSVTKIKSCSNCFGTSGTSGNINHKYNCSNNNGFYRFRCTNGCNIYYSQY